MGDRSGIGWTDATWNPVRGCSRVSEGCRHCYAEVQAERIVRMGRGKPTPYDGLVRLVGGEPRWTGDVAIDRRRLAAPLRWRAPRRVFVDSMADLFYTQRPNEHIAAVFGVMAATPHITYQIEDAALGALNGVVDGIPRRQDALWQVCCASSNGHRFDCREAPTDKRGRGPLGPVRPPSPRQLVDLIRRSSTGAAASSSPDRRASITTHDETPTQEI